MSQPRDFAADLDRWITGNYGEDQFSSSPDDICAACGLSLDDCDCPGGCRQTVAEAMEDAEDPDAG